MNHDRHLPLLIALVIALAACAPEHTDRQPLLSQTPDDMTTVSATPLPTVTPTTPKTATPSAIPSPHTGGMGHGSAGETVTVDIANFAFAPAQLTVRAGTEVAFTNSDAAPHTVTAGRDEAPMPELFDSGLLQTGDEFRFTFMEPGEYAYYCERHPPMTGTIVVED